MVSMSAATERTESERKCRENTTKKGVCCVVERKSGGRKKAMCRRRSEGPFRGANNAEERALERGIVEIGSLLRDKGSWGSRARSDDWCCVEDGKGRPAGLSSSCGGKQLDQWRDWRW
jgi:hypothetical protein